MPVRRSVGRYLDVAAVAVLCNTLSRFDAGCLYTTTARCHECCVANVTGVGAPIVVYHSMGAVRTADNSKDVP